MQSTQIPVKFVIPFANNAQAGTSNPIPVNSQVGITPGAASLHDGFPPLTFLLVGAGGVPPWGRDFNGLFNQVTAWNRWTQAGAPINWDAAFSASIGGYPLGAFVGSATTINLWWLSLVENNTSNPDTGGANWYPCSFAPPVVSSTRNLIGNAPGGTATASWIVTEIIAKSKLSGATFLGSSLSFNFNGGLTGAGGMDVGSIPTSLATDLSIYAIYDPLGGGWSTLGTIACNGETYTGVNLPVGYGSSTASALLWSGKCVGSGVISGQPPGILRFSQVDRKVWVSPLISAVLPIGFPSPPYLYFVNTSNPTSVDISTAVPSVSRAVGGYAFLTTSLGFIGVNISLATGGFYTGLALTTIQGQLSGTSSPPWEIPCVGQQITTAGISGGGSQFGYFTVNTYSF